MNLAISLEMVDLDHHEPNRNSRETKHFWDQLYPLIAAAGFGAIEIPYEPKWDFGGRSGIPRSRRSIETKFGTPSGYLEHLAQAGITHVTGIHFDPSMFLSDNLDQFFGIFRHFAQEALGFAADLQAAYLTLSVSPPLGKLQAVCPQDQNVQDFQVAYLQKAAQLVSELTQEASTKGVRLCIKNAFGSLLRGEAVVPFIRSLPQSVWLDFDTAHLQIAGVDVAAFAIAHADRIGCVHLTDTAFVDSEQAYLQKNPDYPQGAATRVFRDVGTGTIDFAPILKSLTAIGYTGSVTLNSKNTADIHRALLRMRHFANQNSRDLNR